MENRIAIKVGKVQIDIKEKQKQKSDEKCQLKKSH